MPSKDVPHFRLLLQVNGLSLWRRLLSVRQKSKFLVGLITAFLLGYAALAYLLFYNGLRFLSRFPGLGSLLVERLLFLLFACLFGLLLISNLIISYSNLFRNREASFLLTLPIPTRVVFRWKFLESAILASWAFLFLIAPMLLAYGRIHEVAWHFYPATVALVLLFILLPGIAGAAFAVLLARHLDRRAFQILFLGVLIAGLAAMWFRVQPKAVTDEMLLETRVLVVIDRLLDNTRLVQFPFLPSYWLSSAVQNWVEGALGAAWFYAGVLASYTLFFGLLAMSGLGHPFREAAGVVHSRGSLFARWGWFRRREIRLASRPSSNSLLERLVGGIPGLPRDVGAMLVKDIRVFWRDTSQWGQTLMLFGLLAVYLLNLRHFTRQMDSAFWISLTSFLNLGACSLNLATITTRFVFPQFSLEGRRVWVIGMAPLGLARVVWWKFVTGFGTTLVLTLGLTLLSCRMLRLDLPHTVYFAMAITVMTGVLNALAVGLGTVYPNFRETNPSKIVSAPCARSICYPTT
jgi:ABC-2 type transport system permease protein